MVASISDLVSGVSAKQLRANRRNARESTGPRSSQGKARSSQNATRHGIFAASILLPGEDPDQLRQLREDALRHFSPRDGVELEIVEQYISSRRLRRARSAEASLYREQVEVNELDEEDESRSQSPGDILASMIWEDSNSPIERLEHYERRLQDNVHRAINQLRKLRDEHLVGCLDDYTGKLLNELKEESAGEDSAVQNEPISKEDGAKDGPADSCRHDNEAIEAPRGVDDEESEEETEVNSGESNESRDT